MKLHEQVIGETLRIARIPAPTGKEKARADYINRRLLELGYQTEIDQVGNLTAWSGDKPQAPLALLAHMDTVHHSLREINPHRKEDVLHGPGVADNSLGCAALLQVAREMRGQEGLLLVWTVGEESIGNLLGAKHLVEHCKPAEVIAIEGSDLSHVVHQGPGSWRGEIRVDCPGGHSWYERSAPSALHVLLEMLDRIESGQQCMGWNISSVHGGGEIASRAQHAEAKVEFRDIDAQRIEEAVRVLHQVVAEYNQKPVEVHLKELGSRPGGQTDPEHPLVKDALSALHGCGVGVVELFSASTDANAAFAKGVPGVCVGLGKAHAMHTQQERVHVGQLEYSLAALIDLTERRLAAQAA